MGIAQGLVVNPNASISIVVAMAKKVNQVLVRGSPVNYASFAINSTSLQIFCCALQRLILRLIL